MQKPDTAIPQKSLELCLEFTDTVDWRTSNHSKDLLNGYEDLVNWSQRNGVVDGTEARRLLANSKTERAAAEEVLAEAKILRETIYRIFSAAAHGKRAGSEDLRTLNGYLAKAMAKMEVHMTEDGYRLGWCTEDVADKMLYPVAKSAAELLTSEHLARVRECANEEQGCGSMFLDYSKSHSRRWCSMESCGNKVKLRTYYARHGQLDRAKKHTVL
jgi:predicted RNA-binding Zn ribbon-like protein